LLIILLDYTPGHQNISNRQYNIPQKKIDFNMNPPLNAFNINRGPGPNQINFPMNLNMNNINSRNRLKDE